MGTVITAEYLDGLSTEELHGLFWDWYKECMGFRPRHVAFDDRESMLEWCKRELEPHMIAMRQEQFKREKEYWDQVERGIEARTREEEEELGEQICLLLAYNAAYDHFDPRLGRR